MPGELVRLKKDWVNVHLRRTNGASVAEVGPVLEKSTLLVIQSVRSAFFMEDVFVITPTCQGWIDADMLRHLVANDDAEF